MSPALLIVDAQVNMFEPEPAHEAAALLRRLRDLTESARRSGVPVVFVRNNGTEGDPDQPGTAGWEICPALLSAEGDEPIVDKFESNSFAGTGLGDQLRALGVDTVAIAGLQSEYCIQATARGALAEGLHVVLISDAHSTFDDDQPAAAIIDTINADLAAEVDVRDAATVASGW